MDKSCNLRYQFRPKTIRPAQIWAGRMQKSLTATNNKVKGYSITAAKPPFFTILISMVLFFVTFFSTLL